MGKGKEEEEEWGIKVGSAISRDEFREEEIKDEWRKGRRERTGLREKIGEREGEYRMEVKGGKLREK